MHKLEQKVLYHERNDFNLQIRAWLRYHHDVFQVIMISVFCVARNGPWPLHHHDAAKIIMLLSSKFIRGLFGLMIYAAKMVRGCGIIMILSQPS